MAYGEFSLDMLSLVIPRYDPWNATFFNFQLFSLIAFNYSYSDLILLSKIPNPYHAVSIINLSPDKAELPCSSMNPGKDSGAGQEGIKEKRSFYLHAVTKNFRHWTPSSLWRLCGLRCLSRLSFLLALQWWNKLNVRRSSFCWSFPSVWQLFFTNNKTTYRSSHLYCSSVSTLL